MPQMGGAAPMAFMIAQCWIHTELVISSSGVSTIEAISIEFEFNQTLNRFFHLTPAENALIGDGLKS